jgi:hypothetical protein
VREKPPGSDGNIIVCGEALAFEEGGLGTASKIHRLLFKVEAQ